MKPQRKGTKISPKGATRLVAATAVAPTQSSVRPGLLWLAGTIFLVLIPAVIYLIVRGSGRTPVEPTAPAVAGNQATQSLLSDGNDAPRLSKFDEPVASVQAIADEASLIDDDGQTLWASSTHGQPLNLAYLPAGSQIILALRPAALAEHAEGVKVVAALGPLGKRGVAWLKHVTGMALRDMDQLLLGIQAVSDGTWNVSLVIRSKDPIYVPQIADKFPAGEKREQSGHKLWVSGERAYYLPNDVDSHVLVIAPAAAIGEIVALSGNPPPLRRDVERLLAHTDADRQVTLIFAPGFLLSDGNSIFSGEMDRLREPMFWFLGDGLSAVTLSMNWDDNFFLELLALPTLDTAAGLAAKKLADRIVQLPEFVEDYVVRLNNATYGQPIVARFPNMLHKIAFYTRSGVEEDCAALRCYLPAVAGHNLLMGAELTLAQPPGGQTAIAATSTPQPVAVDELLKRSTSLRFSKETLEAALEQLGQDVGMKIVILGKDLQLDGITKNQSLGIDLENKPAGEILVEILRRANPDKGATGPDDARQKLVYVIGPQAPGGPDVVLVTTRARAKERGDRLPLAFEESK